MYDSTTDSVISTVAEEPPPPRTVVVARRALAAGIAQVVLFLLLALYVHEQDHWTDTPEWVTFTRGLILIGLIAVGGLAIYNYLRTRADRLVAAAADRELKHETWESDQFQVLHTADAALAEGLRQLARQQAEAAERQREMYERLHRENVELSGEVRKLRVLVAEHDLRSGRRPSRPRKRRRQGVDARGDNVVPIRARRAADALRRLTERLEDPPKD